MAQYLVCRRFSTVFAGLLISESNISEAVHPNKKWVEGNAAYRSDKPSKRTED